MTTINTTSTQAFTAGLTGPEVNQTVSNARNDLLGQEDFLMLMTTQLQNQDPFSPMENAEFIAQMAQFSTVSGINQLNTTLESVNDRMGEFRISTAATLLGHQVLVPGNIARPDDNGAINGVVDLPVAAGNVTITYRDANTGEILLEQNLGPRTAGLLGFSWEDMPTELRDARNAVQVGVSITTADGVQDVGASVYARVLGAMTDPASADVRLDIEDFGLIDSAEIEAFR